MNLLGMQLPPEQQIPLQLVAAVIKSTEDNTFLEAVALRDLLPEPGQKLLDSLAEFYTKYGGQPNEDWLDLHIKEAYGSAIIPATILMAGTDMDAMVYVDAAIEFTRTRVALGAMNSLINAHNSQSLSGTELMNQFLEHSQEMLLIARKSQLYQVGDLDYFNNAILEMKKSGMYLLPEEWHDYNSSTGGFLPGGLTYFAARPGVGKTALLVTFLVALALKYPKRRFLIVNIELPNYEMLARIYSVLMKVSFQDILNNPLPADKMLAFKKSVIPNLSVYQADFDTKVMEIVAISTGFDLVAIDSAYTLQSGVRNIGTYENVSKVLTIIKAGIAQRNKIPVLITGQLNRDAAKKIAKADVGAIGLEDLGYTDVAGQIATDVWALVPFVDSEMHDGLAGSDTTKMYPLKVRNMKHAMAIALAMDWKGIIPVNLAEIYGLS